MLGSGHTTSSDAWGPETFVGASSCIVATATLEGMRVLTYTVRKTSIPEHTAAHNRICAADLSTILRTNARYIVVVGCVTGYTHFNKDVR